jgi:hypothetical protein
MARARRAVWIASSAVRVLPVDEVEQRLLVRVVQVQPPQRHSDHLRAGGDVRGIHRFWIRELAAAQDQARSEPLSGDDEAVLVT